MKHQISVSRFFSVFFYLLFFSFYSRFWLAIIIRKIRAAMWQRINTNTVSNIKKIMAMLSWRNQDTIFSFSILFGEIRYPLPVWAPQKRCQKRVQDSFNSLLLFKLFVLNRRVTLILFCQGHNTIYIANLFDCSWFTGN